MGGQVSVMTKVRLPPSFPEGESALLGACLLDNEIIDRCLLVVKTRDFYMERNRIVYEAICELRRKGIPADYVTLDGYLKGNKRFKPEEIPGFICELSDAVPSAANWRHYATKIKEMSRLRAIIADASNVVDACYDHDADIEVLASSLQDVAYNATRDTESKGPVDVAMTIPGFARARRDVVSSGISTGLWTVDDVIGGFQPGSLVAISGRPSMGKSSLGLSIARKVAMNHVCCFFSQEMTRTQIETWLISGESGIDGRKLFEGGLSDYEIERAEAAERKVESMALYIDDTPAQTVRQLTAKVKDLAISSGSVDVVFVDHLHLCMPENRRDPQVVALGQISSDLKVLAKKLDLTTVALVQLSRKIEERPIKGGGRIPRDSDLRGSGELEQNIDIHMGLYRPERYIDEMDAKEKAELVPLNKAMLNIDKNRLGRTGRADLLWNGPTTTYSCPERADGPNEQYYMDEV